MDLLALPCRAASAGDGWRSLSRHGQHPPSRTICDRHRRDFNAVGASWNSTICFVYFFLPVSSSHFSPSCFLRSSTFLDASASFVVKAARALAYSESESSKEVMKGQPPELTWGAA